MYIVLTHQPLFEPEFQHRVTACHDLDDAERVFIGFTIQTLEEAGINLSEPLTDYTRARVVLDLYQAKQKIDDDHLIFQIGSPPEKGVMAEVPYIGQPGHDVFDVTVNQAAGFILEAVDEFSDKVVAESRSSFF